MRTHPMLRNVCQRAKKKPVGPLPARLIHISPRYWTIYRSFEISLEWELTIGLEFKSNVLRKSIASKKRSV